MANRFLETVELFGCGFVLDGGPIPPAPFPRRKEGE